MKEAIIYTNDFNRIIDATKQFTSPNDNRVVYKYIKLEFNAENSTVTAVAVDGKTVKTATAKCNPVDRFNFHTGAELAFDRLFEKQHKALDLRNLKAGDKVRVRKDLEAHKSYGNDCAVEEMLERCGKVVTISEVFGNGKYRIAESVWNWTPEMFENI